MKKKHAERSLTGLLAAWLLLMAVWLVPGSAWARIAPNGGEATPARRAYEVLAEAGAAMRGVSTAAPREGEESVAEGQREGVPTEVGALRPAYTAERTTPAVSAREVKPRAPSGNGTLRFFVDSATQAESDIKTRSLFAQAVGGVRVLLILVSSLLWIAEHFYRPLAILRLDILLEKQNRVIQIVSTLN